MGDAADDALDWEMERAGIGRRWHRDGVIYRFGPNFQRTDIWTMKSGETIKLEDMTPSHRGNTIRLLERRIKGLPGVDVGGLHRTPLVKRMKDLGIE